jgi:hypothetical protein
MHWLPTKRLVICWTNASRIARGFIDESTVIGDRASAAAADNTPPI